MRGLEELYVARPQLLLAPLLSTDAPAPEPRAAASRAGEERPLAPLDATLEAPPDPDATLLPSTSDEGAEELRRPAPPPSSHPSCPAPPLPVEELRCEQGASPGAREGPSDARELSEPARPPAGGE